MERFQYPSYSVRIAVMDILQLLAGSGQDVVKFMEKLKFHTFLSGMYFLYQSEIVIQCLIISIYVIKNYLSVFHANM